MNERLQPYGLMAEFDAPEPLVAALRTIRGAGFRRFDAYTAYPIEEVMELVRGERRDLFPLLAWIGGILGAAASYLVQYYLSVHDYPINVGGRPLHSWPMFVPATAIIAILWAAVFVGIGLLAANRLPALYHPVFHELRFSQAREDRFFLCVEAADPRFVEARVLELLRRHRPVRITVLPP